MENAPAVRCADLEIYVSNSAASPNAQRHDKAIFHNNIKNPSKMTSFTYYNKRAAEVERHTKDPGLSLMAPPAEADEPQEEDAPTEKQQDPATPPRKPATRNPVPMMADVANIYLSIKSKMGCFIRILVQSKDQKPAKEAPGEFG